MALKDRARHGVRLLVAPVWHRIWGRIEARLAPIEARLGAGEAATRDAERRLAERLGVVEQTLTARAATFEQALVPIEERLGAGEAAARDAEARLSQRIGALEQTLAQRIAALEQALTQRIALLEQADAAAAERASALETRLSTLESARGEELPAIRNALASVRAFGHELVALRRGAGGVAALRGSAGIRTHPAPASGDFEPRLVVAPRLGARLVVAPSPCPDADLAAALDSLPFAAQSLEEISCECPLERFPKGALIARFLPHWQSLLREGGRFSARALDASALCAAGAELPFARFEQALFHEARDQPLHWLASAQSLVGLLEDAGFRSVEAAPAGGAGFLAALSGRAP